MKKQIISIFLLLLLIAPAVVTYTWIQQRKRAVKKEVKWKMIAGIDKSELVLLKFSKEEITTKLNWKHAKEFEFNHQMYDVVEKQVSKDSIQYWCWWDFKETKLSKQLDDLLAGVFQKDSQSKEKQNKIYSFYKSIYFQSVFSWEPFISLTNKKRGNSHLVFYQIKYTQTSSPPPKFV
ncbi:MULTISPECIES: hypothetical protein [unclassified Flavobacterium]|uniref:hypothetical protein n=1 Tax=unclassified Flavobacterium TaxID=196869 RepID=UPI001291BB8D|nr:MULTISPECIES: hypothetical protein [unclassified Flavobacterium]MQP53372.1 hypothetical protein [Flavobacterium sp. LMO9]MQP62192.1 hypothetical protein [Flavobacterium sp. LMO6]